MTITLISGRQVDSSNLFFNQDTYHITLSPTGEDITNDMRRADKISLFNGFDIEKDNTRLYNETRGGTGPVPPLETNTAVILGQQLLTDPLAAPLDALNNTVNRVFDAPGIKKLLVIAAVLVVGVIILKRK